MDTSNESIRRAAGHPPEECGLPESTYRLQFHAGFKFTDATALIPYLSDLGITHLYASPYLRAKAGSTHGYDVIDHCRINPEVGTEGEYEQFLSALKDRGMSHVLDTVPNHVGVATNDNTWWNDVLENGPASRFASFFDIEWRASTRPGLQDKLFLPLLGGPYAELLERGELKLVFEDDFGSFALFYFERRFPVSPRTYGIVLSHGMEAFERQLPADDVALMEYRSIVTAATRLPASEESDPIAVEERHREKEVVKRRLAKLAKEDARIRAIIEKNVAIFNGRVADARSFDLLDDLIQRQCYRLSYWHVASPEINYRRFFDINDLAALNMRREEVFERTHAFILKLIADGKIAGLRIDHPDGLYDPAEYFSRLQRSYRRQDESKPPLYVTVEKILAVDEPLPTTWPVAGTSGYDFLNMINGLFVDDRGEEPLTRLYSGWTGDATSYDDLVYRNKRLILQTSLSSELHVLACQLDRLAQRDRASRDFTLNGLSRALQEVIACFPVYRTYIVDDEVTEADRKHIENAIEQAISRNPGSDASIFHFVRDRLLQRSPVIFTEQDKAAQIHFAGKFQQLTAPVTAKGIEDTTFYQFNRFISLNEVGGDPGQFGVSAGRLHQYLAERRTTWPYAMSTLSTHDTKRSEDVRARLNVLSEIPEEWGEHACRWRAMNAAHRDEGAAAAGVTPDEEYLIYQTLIGAWPAGPEDDDAEHAAFIDRVQAYMVKAMREAKLRTTWSDPDAAHEEAVKNFIDRILDRRAAAEFRADFRSFQSRVAGFGCLNSLSQTLLKLTCPGVPDTYQGTEMLDLSLVDPDNRRPVDYDGRRGALASIGKSAATSEEKFAPRGWPARAEDVDRSKLLLHARVLRLRRDRPGLFSAGEYVPLEIKGSRADHVFAFVRRHAGMTAIVAVLRLAARLSGAHPPGASAAELWGDTRIELPAGSAGHLTNVFGGGDVDLSAAPSLPAGDLFDRFPVALLVSV